MANSRHRRRPQGFVIRSDPTTGSPVSRRTTTLRGAASPAFEEEPEVEAPEARTARVAVQPIVTQAVTEPAARDTSSATRLGDQVSAPMSKRGDGTNGAFKNGTSFEGFGATLAHVVRETDRLQAQLDAIAARASSEGVQQSFTSSRNSSQERPIPEDRALRIALQLARMFPLKHPSTATGDAQQTVTDPVARGNDDDDWETVTTESWETVTSEDSLIGNAAGTNSAGEPHSTPENITVEPTEEPTTHPSHPITTTPTMSPTHSPADNLRLALQGILTHLNNLHHHTMNLGNISAVVSPRIAFQPGLSLDLSHAIGAINRRLNADPESVTREDLIEAVRAFARFRDTEALAITSENRVQRGANLRIVEMEREMAGVQSGLREAYRAARGAGEELVRREEMPGMEGRLVVMLGMLVVGFWAVCVGGLEVWGAASLLVAVAVGYLLRM